jgi:hypothetical protein
MIFNTPALNKNDDTLDFYNKIEYVNFDNVEDNNVDSKANGFNQRNYQQPASYGFHKNSIWEFQKEVRFKLMVIPYTSQTVRPYIQSEHYSHQGVTLMKTVAPAFLKNSFDVEFIDIDLSDKAIENITVTLGPLCTVGDKIIVESLLKTFSRNGTLKHSNLTDKIRK